MWALRLWGLGKPIAVLVAAALLAMAGWHFATGWRPSTASYPLQGVDLPLEAGPLDWGSVRAAGADFGYVTATRGARDRASGFEANWAALPEAGLRRGAVHLYSLCEDAQRQANLFNVVVPRAGDALPATVDLDLRDDCTDRPARDRVITDLRRFIATVETHTGKQVMLRVSRPMERAYGITVAIDRPIWAVGNLLSPRYPARAWRMWRATNWRHVDGVGEAMNWDVVAP